MASVAGSSLSYFPVIMNPTGLQKETRVIGELEYEVTQLPGGRARQVFLRFAKLVAPVLKDLAEVKAKGEQASKEELLSAFMTGAAKLAENLNPDDLDFFVEQFASSTTVSMFDGNGKKRSPKLSEIIALHFIGDRFADQFAWLTFCFEVNYRSFFQRLGQQKSDT